MKSMSAKKKAYVVGFLILACILLWAFLSAGFMTNGFSRSQIKKGDERQEVDVESVIKFNKVPTLFIHGEKDSFVPSYMSEKLFNTKEKGYNKLVKFENAEHCMSYASDKEKYVNIISEFISSYFK